MRNLREIENLYNLERNLGNFQEEKGNMESEKSVGEISEWGKVNSTFEREWGIN